MYTVKPVFFTCPLFCKFHDLGEFTKMVANIQNLMLFLVYYLVQQAKTPKLRAPK